MKTCQNKSYTIVLTFRLETGHSVPQEFSIDIKMACIGET